MKRLVALAAVAVFAVPLALTATAPTIAAPRVVHSQAPPPKCSAKLFGPFADAVWRLILWERGKPPARVIQAQRRRLACAGPKNRKAMRKRWRKDQRAYNHYRAHKLAARNTVQATIDAVGIGTLESIAACESGGNPRAISPGGQYRGLLQFDYETWESVGGTGDPAAASRREQLYRGALLYLRTGPSSWPVCGV